MTGEDSVEHALVQMTFTLSVSAKKDWVRFVRSSAMKDCPPCRVERPSTAMTPAAICNQYRRRRMAVASSEHTKVTDEK